MTAAWPESQPDLWDSVRTIQAGLRGKHAQEIQALVPLARQLAAAKGDYGVTVGEIRYEAMHRGLLPQKGSGRALSWLVALPKAAGLVKTPRRRLSPLADTRNANTVYVLREAK